jgi:type IV pilus assembly protein PilN
MLKKIIKLIMDYLSKLSVEQEDVVGVDITPSSIRLAQLQSEGNKWILTKLGYKYIEEGSDVSIKDRSEEYVNKLSQIITTSKITTTNAAVSIPVSSAIIKVVTLPIMTDEELQEAVDTNTLWENAIQITDNLDEYSIFWQVLKRNASDNQMDLLFVASKLDDIDHYLNIVRQAGLKPVVVDVRCFAIRNALELRKDLTKGDTPIAIVEFGAYENYILILHGDSPFISDIYLSDKDKRLISDPSIDPVLLEGVSKRFVMQINQMLSSYQAKYKIQPIESLLISSSISVIDKVLGHLQEGMPTIKIDIFNALRNVTVPENLKEKTSAEPNSSIFSSVLGLATRKLDVFGYYEYITGTNNINLLPDRDGVKAQEKMKFLSRWGIVIFVVLSFSFGLWSFFSGQSESEELNQRMTEYQNLEMQKNEKETHLAEIESKKQALSGMLKAGSGIVSNKKFMYAVLMDINTSLPQGISFSNINYTGGDTLKIDGLSVSDQNILQFIEQLTNSNSINKASLLTMSVKTVGKRTVKSFSIKCNLINQTTINSKGASNGR